MQILHYLISLNKCRALIFGGNNFKSEKPFIVKQCKMPKQN
ncbi:hypothetical protein X975_13537, partial [Stegodyphus mimosarum]